MDRTISFINNEGPNDDEVDEEDIPFYDPNYELQDEEDEDDDLDYEEEF